MNANQTQTGFAETFNGLTNSVLSLAIVGMAALMTAIQFFIV